MVKGSKRASNFERGELCSVARLKTSRQRAAASNLRAGVLVNLNFRLLCGLTGVGTLLTIFWLVLNKRHVSGVVRASNFRFWYFFCIFFFFGGGEGKSRFRFVSKWHALEFEAACQRCVQPEHAEKHTQGEEGSSNVKNFVKIKGRS